MTNQDDLLRQLAATQAGNPQNSWMRQPPAGYLPVEPPTRDIGDVDAPGFVPGYLGDVDAPGFIAGQNGPGYAKPSAAGQGNAHSAPQAGLGAPQPFNPGLQGQAATMPSPGYAAPASPAAAPKKASGAAGSSGKAPAQSPERNELAEEESVRRERANILDIQAESVRKQQDILRTGEGVAVDQLKKAGIDDTINQVELEQLQSRALHDANTRDIELNRDAELLRKEKVDPQHWWKDKGTGGSILAAIAIGAGAFAAAMPHTGNHENQALGIINKAIDRDIAGQEDMLNRKWKALDWQGQKNHEQFVRDNWMVNQKNEAKRTGYDHAMAMVAQQRVSTNNQVAAQNLDGLYTELSQKKEDLKVESARHRMQVSVTERAQAAAAAANSPAAKMGRDYDAYLKKVADENASHPDKPSAAMSRSAYLQYRGIGAEGGAPAPAATGGPHQQKAAEAKKAADYLRSSGASVSKANVYDNPENVIGVGANPRRDLDAWNSRMIASVHATSVGLRAPELVKEITGPFHLSPWDSEKTMQQKIENAAKYLEENPPVGEVPGATPVGATEVK